MIDRLLCISWMGVTWWALLAASCRQIIRPLYTHTNITTTLCPPPHSVMWYLEVLRDRFHFLILVSGSCPASSHFGEIKKSVWTLQFLFVSILTLSVLFALGLFKPFASTPNKRIGWLTLMLHWLEEFFFKRISNRIGGSPDHLLMKYVREGGPAIFKDTQKKSEIHRHKSLSLCYLHFWLISKRNIWNTIKQGQIEKTATCLKTNTFHWLSTKFRNSLRQCNVQNIFFLTVPRCRHVNAGLCTEIVLHGRVVDYRRHLETPKAFQLVYCVVMKGLFDPGSNRNAVISAPQHAETSAQHPAASSVQLDELQSP